MYGAGSWNSPIWISEDEDEATVELELERRLASPRDDIDYDDDWNSYDNAVGERLWGSGYNAEYEDYEDDYEDPQDFEPEPPVAVGQKRKRDTFGRPPTIAEPMHRPPVSAPRTLSPKLAQVPQAESKNARKKRRKRERQEAEALVQTFVAGPSKPRTTPIHPLPPPPLALPPLPTPLGTSDNKTRMRRSTIPFQQSFALPMRPVSHNHAPPPMNGSMFLNAPPAPPAPPSAPFVSHALPPPPIPPPHAFAPPIVPFSRPAPPPRVSPRPPSPPPQLPVKRQIGRPPEEDPDGKHGAYNLPDHTLATRDRTLVMELLPKKFRTLEFLSTWASGYAANSAAYPHVLLNAKAGRGLIVFQDRAQAQAAWESPRMSGNGKEHIRVWWYSGPEKSAASSSKAKTAAAKPSETKASAVAVELEEGEIEEEEEKDTAQVRRATAKVSIGKSVPKAMVQPKQLSRLATAPAPQHAASSSSTRIFPNSSNSRLPELASRLEPAATIVAPSKPAPLAPTPQSALAQVMKTAVPREPAPLPSTPTTPRSPFMDDVEMEIDSDDGVVDALLGDVSTSSGSVSDSAAKPMSAANSPVRAPGPVSPSPAAARELPMFVDSPAGSPVSSTQHSPTKAHGAKQPLSSMLLSPPGYKLLAVVSPDSSPLRGATHRPAHPPPPPLVLAPPVIPPPTPSLSSTRESSSSDSVQELLVTKTPTPPPADVPSTKDALHVKKFLQARLQARQKELQEKIARTKAELAARSVVRSGATTPTLPASSDAPAVRVVSVRLTESVDSAEVPDSSANVAKEENLRRLVLGSKRIRMATTSSTTTTTTVVTHTDSTPQDHREEERTDSAHNETQPHASGHTSKFVPNKNQSLDDLAVSFIADALHSAAAHTSSAPGEPALLTVSAPISTSPSPPPMSEKALLAARQHLLELRIAECKSLFTKMEHAASAKEKVAIKKAIDERLRSIDEEKRANVRYHANASYPRQAMVQKSPWPTSNSCVIPLSDDEESDDDYED